MKKIFLSFVYLLIGLFVYLFIPLSWVAASGEFQADYNVQYAISPTGTTIVTQNITLTNKQTNLYPQKYSILLDTTKIKNVIAYDSHQIVPTDITQLNGKTQIVLTFNDQVVGIGRQLAFTLRFENGDIAQKNGSIWEVNVPGITPDADIQSYNVSLSVPTLFGPNAYTSPPPANGSTWTREQMIAGGISAAYGTTQSFDTHLSYYIQNSTVTSATEEIALPPDTAYQKVTIVSINPQPDSVVRDTDGNWLARYTMLPGASYTVQAVLHIDVTLGPRAGYTDDQPDASLYTSQQKYWETQNPKIEALAKQYTTPKSIYTYVVSALSYDYSRVDASPIRKGAVSALASPKNSVCMEFTDLFVAIARAAGIPAREAVGYAYTNNSRLRPLSLVTDVLHAWPEYYDNDKKVWVAVDPTWANTTKGVNYFDKMDFNHIVFALQGVKSDYPYPAGFYRKSGKTTKDVEVSFATGPFTTPVPSLSAKFSFPTTITSGIRSDGSVTITNTTGVAVPGADIVVQSSPVDIGITKTVTNIPPYGKIVLPLTMTVPNYLTHGTGRFVVSISGQTSQFGFTIQPITTYFLIPIISFSVILLILIVMTVERARIWKRFKKR